MALNLRGAQVSVSFSRAPSGTSARMSVHTDEYFAVCTLITYPECVIKPRRTKLKDLRYSLILSCIFVM